MNIAKTNNCINIIQQVMIMRSHTTVTVSLILQEYLESQSRRKKKENLIMQKKGEPYNAWNWDMLYLMSLSDVHNIHFIYGIWREQRFVSLMKIHNKHISEDPCPSTRLIQCLVLRRLYVGFIAQDTKFFTVDTDSPSISPIDTSDYQVHQYWSFFRGYLYSFHPRC